MMKRVIHMYTFIHKSRWDLHDTCVHLTCVHAICVCTCASRAASRSRTHEISRYAYVHSRPYSNAFSHAWRKKAYENEGIAYTAVLNQMSSPREKDPRIILKIKAAILRKQPIFLLLLISIFNLIYFDILTF